MAEAEEEMRFRTVLWKHGVCGELFVSRFGSEWADATPELRCFWLEGLMVWPVDEVQVF